MPRKRKRKTAPRKKEAEPAEVVLLSEIDTHIMKDRNEVDDKMSILKEEVRITKRDLDLLASKFRTVERLVERNSRIVESQVEDKIPREIASVRGQLTLVPDAVAKMAEINKKVEATKMLMEKILAVILKLQKGNLPVGAESDLPERVAKMEEKMHAFTSENMLHLVDKLEGIRQDLKSSREQIMPQELSEKLQRLDLKMQQLERTIQQKSI